MKAMPRLHACKSLQDAVKQHTAHEAERAREHALKDGPGRSGGPPKGRLPNLLLGSYGDAALHAHMRFQSLPSHQQFAAGSIQDEDLPHIPQRTEPWFHARRSAITASNAALWLGMKEPEMSRELASKGLKVFAQQGHLQLLEAFQTLTDPDAAKSEKRVSPHSACAMAMGTLKEPDVLLTYAQHMDASDMCVSPYSYFMTESMLVFTILFCI